MNKDIKELLSKMTNDINSNIKSIKEVFKTLSYCDSDKQSLLHIFVDKKYNEDKCFLAIKSLLRYGLDPNLNDCFQYNFIQTALYSGYSENFIINILNEAFNYGLDVNHIDSDKDTMMHTAIYSDDYLGGINNIFTILFDHGFDSFKLDKNGKNILGAIKKMNKKYNEEAYNSFIGIVNKKINEKNSKPISKEELNILSEFGTVLDFKDYRVSPSLGRELELKNIIYSLAQEYENPLLIGNNGVGKTVIIKELAYDIEKGNVPEFLKGKTIYDLNPASIGAGTKKRGSFEEKLQEVLNICCKYNVIIFIDDIHTIYGIGTYTNKNLDMAQILNRYIDRFNLKVIGATTLDDYNKYISNTSLNRRFKRISIDEPNNAILYDILIKVIKDFEYKNNISFEDELLETNIAKVLVSTTNRGHANNVSNPSLSISIIDGAFAIAKVNNSKCIGVNEFMASIQSCDKLSNSTRKKAIEGLKLLNPKLESEKVLKLEIPSKKEK